MFLDDEIIAILFVFFIATVAWRYLFRWDTRNRLKRPGQSRNGGIEFIPPFSETGNTTIAVVSSARWNLAVRCTWLVQGLLAAGFRVLLISERSPLLTCNEQSSVHDVIFYNSFSSTKKTSRAIEQARGSGVKRVILVNFGGNRGLKNIRSSMLDTSDYFPQKEKHIYLISETKLLALPAEEQRFFEEIFLVQRSRGQLRDAELLVVGTIFRWIA